MKKKLGFFFTILGISFCCSFVSTFFIGSKLEKVIINYATVETERVASVILNEVVDLDDDIFDNDFFQLTKDSEGNIQLIDFDSKMTNQLLKYINEEAIKRLKALEKGEKNYLELSDSLNGTRLTYLKNGIVCDIPIGVLFNNALIVNMTTSIPIKFSFIGTVSSNLVTNVKEYGFNNALIEVGVEVTIKEKITMPHSTKSIPITTKINITTQVVQGQVPLYYNGMFSNSSSTFYTK